MHLVDSSRGLTQPSRLRLGFGGRLAAGAARDSRRSDDRPRGVSAAAQAAGNADARSITLSTEVSMTNIDRLKLDR